MSQRSLNNTREFFKIQNKPPTHHQQQQHELFDFRYQQSCAQSDGTIALTSTRARISCRYKPLWTRAINNTHTHTHTQTEEDDKIERKCVERCKNEATSTSSVSANTTIAPPRCVVKALSEDDVESNTSNSLQNKNKII